MKKNKVKQTDKSNNPKFITSLLLIAYGFVTVLTPNFRTLDSNGPKFLSFAILNIVTFFILFSIKDIRNNKKLIFGFFDNKIGFVYTLLMVLSLLSFTKAINVSESILHFAKIFTPFAAAWMISIIVRYDRYSIRPLAISMSILLFIDSYQTFEGVSSYIKGKISNIALIKASYSNKNILTSAIFIKTPFALWLFLFSKKWTKYLGTLALFTSFLAIFFLSARAFYLATIIIFILLTVYLILKYKSSKDKKHLYTIGSYFLILVLSFGIFSFVESNIYPKSKVDSRSFTARMKSITDSKNNSNSLRLRSWKYSLKLIKKDPILGVGLGNWKIRVLEYENQDSDSYTYMYKNHNDFIEITAEVGVIAGILFISIFLFILWYFAISFYKKSDEEAERLLFLPALGIIAYSFDAFFNFPQDRPEIQSLFAVYIGISIGLALFFFKEDNPIRKFVQKVNKKPLQIIATAIITVLLSGSIYILYKNVQSLKLQRFIKEELNSGKLKSSSKRFLNAFPIIPNITILAEPIAVQKARYLINEKQHKKAIKLLKSDNSNPFDARKEYFMAQSFYRQKKYDSAVYYAEIGHKIKPLFYGNNTILASSYEKLGKFDKSIKIWEDYLKRVKNKPKPWVFLASILKGQKKIDKAKKVIDSAYKYHPNNKQIKNLKNVLYLSTEINKEDLEYYNKAISFYKKRDYKKAIELFTIFIEKVPKYIKSYELRASSYFLAKEYQKALNDILTIEKLGGTLEPNIINIKGSCYLMLNDRKKAEQYFIKAMKLGNKDAKTNYNKFFKKKNNSTTNKSKLNLDKINLKLIDKKK